MTLDGLLTFITLLVAALAFLPAIALLRMRVILPRWLTVAAAGLASVLYFEFFRVTAMACPRPLGRACVPLEAVVGTDTGSSLLDGRETAFIVVLVWMLLAWWLLGGRTAPPRAYVRMRRMVDRLIVEGRLSDLLDLVEPNLPGLVRAANRRLPVQRFSDRLRIPPAITFELLQTPIGEPTSRERTPTLRERTVALRQAWRRWSTDRVMRPVGNWLADHLPSGAAPAESAAAMLTALATHRGLREHIVTARPAFGAVLMRIDHHLADDFATAFLTELVGRRGSALYDEIAASQSFPDPAYALAPEAAILHALLDDASVSTRIGAERAIAERALANLESDGGDAYAASLNRPPDNRFDEFGKWEDPTFIAIRYFEIMLPAAATQGIEWHMSLTYMRDFARHLVERYDDTGPGVDPSREWPTRGAYLLYSIFAALADWVELAAKLPAGSPHRAFEDDRVEWENGNIPKTAALVLGDCLATVIASDAVGDHLKGYLLDIALRAARKLGSGEELAALKRVTLRSIARGGILDAGEEHRATLRALHEDLDIMMRMDLRDFETMIASAPASPIPSPAPPKPSGLREKIAHLLSSGIASTRRATSGSTRAVH